jgi:uncharacterized Ntn-hydrolase superfamily protein
MNHLHTFSIVARDPKNGQLGIAVQSHWFGVGALCPWIEAGVGAIATQSMVEISYGPWGLDLLRKGKTAEEVLQELTARDDQRELRQVAIVDSLGNVATHTGNRCIEEAGHSIGNQYSVQANMMKYSTVWPAMAEAFEKDTGDLADRMLSALYAAQAAGGDIRGKQSAAMLVAENEKSDKPWQHMLFNLRVDDHPEPLNELERLIKVQRAYRLMNEGDELLSKHEIEAAMQHYSAAEQHASHTLEIPFWQAVTLADMGQMEKALPIFARVFKQNPDWAELVQRLPKAGLLRNDPDMMKRILEVMNHE